MRRAVQRVAERREAGGTETINLSSPSNVASGNIGEEGAVHGTPPRQTVRLRQDGRETLEENARRSS